MNITNLDEVYKVAQYSFNVYDVANEFVAQEIARRFFEKYHENDRIKQIYYEFDAIDLKHRVYLAY